MDSSDRANDLNKVYEFENQTDNNLNKSVEIKGYAMENFFISLFVLFILFFMNFFSIILLDFNIADSMVIIFVSLVLYVALVAFLRSYRVKERKVIFDDKPSLNEAILGNLDMNFSEPDYIGSMKTKRYHLRNCRVAKKIKQEVRLEDTNVDFFKKRKFKACKICIKKKKQ